MDLCSPVSIETTSNSKLDDDTIDDDQQFREIVFEFIERIGKEVCFYENYDPSTSASDFKHIELQIQAQRVGKVLELCISKIKLVFDLSYLFEHQHSHLILYFHQNDAKAIELFFEKWVYGMADATSNEFKSDLNRCLDIIDRTRISKNNYPVITIVYYIF